MSFASPVAIDANTTYVASYHAPNGNYAATRLLREGRLRQPAAPRAGRWLRRREWHLQVRALGRALLRRRPGHVRVEQLLGRRRLRDRAGARHPDHLRPGRRHQRPDSRPSGSPRPSPARPSPARSTRVPTRAARLPRRPPASPMALTPSSSGRRTRTATWTQHRPRARSRCGPRRSTSRARRLWCRRRRGQGQPRHHPPSRVGPANVRLPRRRLTGSGRPRIGGMHPERRPGGELQRGRGHPGPGLRRGQRRPGDNSTATNGSLNGATGGDTLVGGSVAGTLTGGTGRRLGGWTETIGCSVATSPPIRRSIATAEPLPAPPTAPTSTHCPAIPRPPAVRR